ncbi:MAG TPA: HAD family hydrolase [Acidobacteriota bacterium]|nr:HAD family hydrolase [Acidobacteriota bacterium]
MNLILFDIDGTLLRAHGAGHRALDRAVRQAYGIENGLHGIRPDGKTDLAILREALARFDIEMAIDGCAEESVFNFYLEFLDKELARPPQGSTVNVLPGVVSVLTELSGSADFLVGIGTGNIEEGAKRKLSAAGLADFFVTGGYGSDAEDRTEILKTGIERGKELAGDQGLSRIFVIGDTPRDVESGRAVGARTVAVATGSYGFRQLTACRPALTLESLEPAEPLFEFLRRDG